MMKMKNSAFLLLVSVSAFAQVNIKGKTVDATQGYTYQGVAPSNHVLMGNGTAYVDAVIPSVTPNTYTFTPRFSVTGAAPNYSVDLAGAGTSGTYSLPLSITFDAYGRATSVTSSTPGASGTYTCPSSVTFDTYGRATSVTSGTCIPAIPGTLNDVTGSRSVGAAYQNTNSSIIFVSAFFSATGSAYGEVDCNIGTSSGSLQMTAASQTGATTDGRNIGVTCMVPAGSYYSITRGGSTTFGTGRWTETVIR